MFTDDVDGCLGHRPSLTKKFSGDASDTCYTAAADSAHIAGRLPARFASPIMRGVRLRAIATQFQA